MRLCQMPVQLTSALGASAATTILERLARPLPTATFCKCFRKRSSYAGTLSIRYFAEGAGSNSDSRREFKIAEIKIGKKRADQSFARIEVSAESGEALDELVLRLRQHGAEVAKSCRRATGEGAGGRGFPVTIST